MINICVHDMVLDLMYRDIFCYQMVVGLVKMLWYLVLLWVYFVHLGDKKKDISILSKGPTGGLDDTTLTAKKEYFINYTEQQKNSYTLVNSVEIYKFKVKDFEINTTPLSVGNVPKDFPVGNMKKIAIHRYVIIFQLVMIVLMFMIF